MTGTGTQQDPFIVDNWTDFVTAVGTTDAYVAFPETSGIINMNDEALTGLLSAVTLNCADIKGNGWQIRNLYSIGNHNVFYNSKNLVVSNLDFINMYIDFQNNYGRYFWKQNTNNCQAKFNGCTFSGLAIKQAIPEYPTYVSSIFYSTNYNSKIQLNSCALTLQLQGAMEFWDVSDSENSNVTSFTTIKLSGNSEKSIEGCYKNCKFTGTSKSTSLDIRYNSISNYNVFDVDFSDASSFSCIAPNNTINLINTDKLPTGATVGTGFIGVTTAQLADASYLSSLGFPIAEE